MRVATAWVVGVACLGAGCGSDTTVSAEDVRPALEKLPGYDVRFIDVKVHDDDQDVIAGSVSDRSGTVVHFAVLVGGDDRPPGLEQVLPELNGADAIADGNVLVLTDPTGGTEPGLSAAERIAVDIEVAVFRLAPGLRNRV